MKKAAVGERVHDETKNPPRNKGLQMKKAAVGATVPDGTRKTPRNMAPETKAIGQVRNSSITAAILERVHDETMADWNEEGAQNIVENATNIGELNTEVTGLTDDEEIGVYTDRASRDAVDEVRISELNTDAAGVANEDIRLYHHDAFRDAGDEDNVGELNPDAVGQSDDEEIGVYNDRASRELNIDAAGVADDEDNRVYPQGAFRDADDQDSVGAPNTDAAGVADDDDTGVYHLGADEYSVRKLHTDAAGDEETGLCLQGAFCDADDEGFVGEPNTGAAGFADDDDTGVYHQQAIRDAGPQHNVGELGSDVSGFDGYKAVRIRNSQAFPNPSDEPMGDVPNDKLESSRDDSSDLTSYNTGSHSPNIIAKGKSSSEVYAGMELPDHAMGEPKGRIFSDIKDVIMGEAEDRTEGGAEDRPGETAQRI